MSIEKMRSEFEAWCKGKYPNSHFGICKKEDGYRFSVGQYVDANVHIRWDAWQASRAAIEAPSFKMYSHEGCDYYDAEAVDNAMEDLGIKVKA